MENDTEMKAAVEVKDEKPVKETTAGEEAKTDESKSNDAKIKEELKTEDVKDDKAKNEETTADIIKNEEPSEELLNKIRTQVEFYFGDINLQRDKFLIEQTKLDEGWIPMTVMLNFKLLASMSKDPEVILKALESSELIEVSEDRKKIRRSLKNPLPVFDEAYKKAQAEKTVYIKGFPLTDIYIQKLKEFFQNYEPFENIIMRKYLDKEKKLKFKGSIFVQFKTLEDAKAFMARESVKYGETELIRKFSEEYSVEKAKENEERKQKKSLQNASGNADKSKVANARNDGKTESDAKPTARLSEFQEGSILHFTGAVKNTNREMIKKSLMDIGAEIAFVDYTCDDESGWVRLQGVNSAKLLIDKMTDGVLEINNGKVTFKVLEDEDEKKYREVVEESFKVAQARHKYPRRSRGAKSYRGNRSQKMKRKFGGAPNSHDQVPSKKKASE